MLFVVLTPLRVYLCSFGAAGSTSEEGSVYNVDNLRNASIDFSFSSFRASEILVKVRRCEIERRTL